MKEGSNKSNGMCYLKHFLYCKFITFRLLSFMTRKWKEYQVKKSIQQGLKGGKIRKLTAVDIGQQYLDSLKEIGKEWRRLWV